MTDFFTSLDKKPIPDAKTDEITKALDESALSGFELIDKEI